MLEGLIITFIGLPGSGKTTIAKDVVNRLSNAVLMPEVAEIAVSKGFEVADRASIGTETWFLTQYYTRGVEAKKLRDEGKIVVMDGNYANSMAFAFANFVASNNPSFFMHFPSYIVNKAVGTLIKPDVYIYLDISVQDSVKYQLGRGREELRTRSERVLSNVERFYKAFFSFLEPEIPMHQVGSTRPLEDVIRDVDVILTKELKLEMTKKLK